MSLHAARRTLQDIVISAALLSFPGTTQLLQIPEVFESPIRNAPIVEEITHQLIRPNLNISHLGTEEQIRLRELQQLDTLTESITPSNDDNAWSID